MLLRSVLILLSCIASTAASAYVAQPNLQPTEYVSASGEYRWLVDPSERSGAGNAHYTLSSLGRELLSGEQGFTLLNAVVASDGALFGYAYTLGRNSVVEPGEFLVVRIDGKGEVSEMTRAARERSHFLHTDPDPKVAGLMLDPQNDRFVVRVPDPDVNRGRESWWRYRLSTAESIDRVEPHSAFDGDPHLRRVRAALPLAGSALTLVQWQRWDQRSGALGSRFALLDQSMQAKWSADWVDDYSRGRTPVEASQLIGELPERGAILSVDRPDRFALWQAATAERVEFEVREQADGAWHVRESARSPLPAPTAKLVRSSVPAPPARTLEKLGSIELDQATRADSWGHLIDFAIDGDGRFGLLRCTDCDAGPDFVLMDGDGEVVLELALKMIPADQSSSVRLTWINDARWLLTYNLDPNSAAATWIDVDSGGMQPLSDFRSAPIDSLAASTDGIFAALTLQYVDFSVDRSLLAFDAAGRQRWKIEESSGDDSKLFSPQDLAITSDGDVVVLEGASRKLKRFDRNGQHLRSTELSSAWGRRPNYLSGLEADLERGLIVHDFDGNPSIVQMDANDRVLAEFTPKHPDGQGFALRGNVQRGPDGRFWTSDGSALMRMDQAGVVDRTLGPAASSAQLGGVAALAVSRSGQIYAADTRTGAVHVYAATGARLRVCAPAAGDYEKKLGIPSLKLSDDGAVYISRHDVGSDGPPDFLHYDADCQRIGVVGLNRDEYSLQWLPQSGSDRHWLIGSNDIYLTDGQGLVQTTFQRTASGRWLSDPELAVSGPDGSLLVVSENGYTDRTNPTAQPVFARFAADGTPLAVWPAPAGLVSWSPMAMDDQHLAFLVASDPQQKQRAVWISGTDGRLLFRFEPAAGPPTHVFLVSTATDRELWLFDGKRRIDRYRIASLGP